MTLLFYNIFLRLYLLGARLASLGSIKAGLWLRGRQNLFAALEDWRGHFSNNEKIIWFHCASLGEFEQGRPIMESIKENYPSYKILLTFFSPSGYEIRKNYPLADAVFYLPMDGKKNASAFIDIVRPTLVIWVKYEYWYYYLTRLKEKNISVILVSAIFRDNQPFFKWYGNLWKIILQSFTKIFVQDEESIELLKGIGLDSNAMVAGDTRFDRVIAIAEKENELPLSLINFCKGNKVIVAGSTWEEDEAIIVHYAKIHHNIKFIIAPHEIAPQRLSDLKKLFNGSAFYTEFMAGKTAVQVIIVDNIGMLSKLYRLASIAYIGGGFNDTGIHNVLEAAVYGKPLIFGPVYEKFGEAVSLVNRQAAYPVEHALALESLLDKLLMDEHLRHKAADTSKHYVYENIGATNSIIEYLQANRLLIN